MHFKKILIALCFVCINSYGAKVNFIHLKIYPATCNDLQQVEECFTSLDSSSFDLILKKKILKKEEGVLGIVNVSISQNEMNLLDSLLFDVYNEMKKEDKLGIYLTDTTFYIEFARGYNQKKEESIKVGGIVNCIIFLDRIKEKIKIISGSSYLITSLENNEQILIYDRLCKCSKP